jgi:heme-degrading monooxygenase HmoA
MLLIGPRSRVKLIGGANASQEEEEAVQTIGIVLNVGTDQTKDFEEGFREQEAPIWSDLHQRGLLVMATLTRLDISTRKVDDAVQYLVVAIFATDEGHHAHDNDPRFEAWNKRADTYQIAEPFVFGGDTIVNEGP